jgi:hypothetical protein
MYCPSCGSEERQLSQFCRACGTDLRVVRNSLERTDAITASAVTAREQIGMAVADQIRQMKSAKDLETVAEDVLPSFEKFLESPEEKRLRRIRNGVITAAVGLGGGLAVFIMALNKMDLLPMMLPWLITFMVGVGVIVNGLLFTVPRKELPGDAADAMSQKALDMNRGVYETPGRTNELGPGMQPQASITEHTTHHLTTSKN